MKRVCLVVVALSLVNMLPNTAQASNQTWKISKNQFTHNTAGYLSAQSILPGSPLQAFITCKASTFSIELFRMGFYNGDEAQSIWQSETLPCQTQSAPKFKNYAQPIAANWKSSLEIPTEKLTPGFYLAKIVASDKSASFMSMVIRSETTNNRVVMVMPTMTSLAYNNWAKYSAYTSPTGFTSRARLLSFNLPQQWGYGSGLYLHYVHPLLVVASQTGIDLAFVSDVDIASDPTLLNGARAYVSPGHDEYWTSSERLNVIAARDKGTNLLFMGANVAYWRVRLTKAARGENPVMEIYKSSSADPNKTEPTIRFRDVNLPESHLTGLEYKCFPAAGKMKIKDPTSWVFQGTGVSSTSEIETVIGPEIDSLPRVNSFDGKITILTESAVACGDQSKARHKVKTQMILGISPNGAGTFSVGTMNWVVRGLKSSAKKEIRDFTVQVTSNVLKAAAQGPLGKYATN